MKRNRKVVYSTVIADVFHYGHLQSLQFAKKQGDVLVCGILTDDAAMHYKKSLISTLAERKAIIESLYFVDRVMIQKEADPTLNLKRLHIEYPNATIILIHGDDWRQIPGSVYIKAIHGKVVTHPYYTNLSDVKIVKKFLDRYRGKFKDFEEFQRYFDLKDFTYYNPRRIEKTAFSSKADTLRFLKPLLKHSHIEDILVFTVFDWKEERQGILAQIRKQFSPSPIVVRSSSITEDADNSSYAGYFHSALNVPSTNNARISHAIETVVNSYNEKKSDFPINQILVQRHSKDIILSGVLFTRDLEKDAPYIVINYDTSGSTDSVTKGVAHRHIKILHTAAEQHYPGEFRILLKAIREIQSHIKKIDLDIEFAIDRKNRVIIFQVRPLSIHAHSNHEADNAITNKVKSLQHQFIRLGTRRDHLAGSNTLFADMPDWNPAEIIGNNPHHLDFSLYDYIITKNAWHIARTSQYYFNVDPAPLVALFGNKPYVDVRNSFNSFTLASMSKPLREKLVSFYISKLKSNPELQDKIEFQIVFSCYDFSFRKRSRELLEQGFSTHEISQIKDALLHHTNQLLAESESSITCDIKSVMTLSQQRSRLNNEKKDPHSMLLAAKHILDECSNYGTIQFSRLARLAFIGSIIMKSMVAEKIIDTKFYDSFMNSIHTVAKQMSIDFDRFAQGKLPKPEFMKKYGHLRPGTYDITSTRYDMNPSLLTTAHSKKPSKQRRPFMIPEKTQIRIDQGLQKHGLLMSGRQFLNFTKKSIEARELSKFEFTKALSDAMEDIAEAGYFLGFSRLEMAHLGVDDLFTHLSLDSKSLSSFWRSMVNKRIAERKLQDMLSLPPIISTPVDLEIVGHYIARPNFITQKSVEAEIINVTDARTLDVQGKIVLLENGDPGYDWIFTKNPAGLITKYGGVASHMAIRTAEFGLPAAIGCGEQFDALKNCKRLLLDCAQKKIIPLP